MKKYCMQNILNTVACRKIFLTNHFHFLLLSWWIFLTLCHGCVSVAPKCRRCVLHVIYVFPLPIQERMGEKHFPSCVCQLSSLKKSAT